MREWIFRACLGMAAACALVLTTGGCGGLDDQGLPDLAGPSDAGVSVELSAAPDTVNADGVSTSRVRLTLRDNVGSAIVGYPVLFSFDGDGLMYPATGSRYVGPVQTGLVMATDQNGQADVIYVAGWGIGSVFVAVRPYSIDSSFGFWRWVEIWQR